MGGGGGGGREEPRFEDVLKMQKVGVDVNQELKLLTMQTIGGRGQCDPGIESILKMQKIVGVDVNQEFEHTSTIKPMLKKILLDQTTIHSFESAR